MGQQCNFEKRKNQKQGSKNLEKILDRDSTQLQCSKSNTSPGSQHLINAVDPILHVWKSFQEATICGSFYIIPVIGVYPISSTLKSGASILLEMLQKMLRTSSKRDCIQNIPDETPEVCGFMIGKRITYICNREKVVRGF